MLSYTHRFHGHGSLKYVFKNGQTVRTRYFAIKYVVNDRRRHSRVAVVVSRKIHKHAVKRNQVRRRLYEIIRQDLLPTSSVFDIVVIVTSPELIAMTPPELHEQLTAGFTEAGIYQDRQ